jgi:hypothetical protein
LIILVFGHRINSTNHVAYRIPSQVLVRPKMRRSNIVLFTVRGGEVTFLRRGGEWRSNCQDYSLPLLLTSQWLVVIVVMSKACNAASVKH